MNLRSSGGILPSAVTVRHITDRWIPNTQGEQVAVDSARAPMLFDHKFTRLQRISFELWLWPAPRERRNTRLKTAP